MRKMYRDYVTRLLFSRKYMYMYCTLDNRSRNDNFNFTVSLSLSIYTCLMKPSDLTRTEGGSMKQEERLSIYLYLPDEAIRPGEDGGCLSILD